ncbi:SRP68 [[Candida] subhashii]|uniref:Signal recognition particle subunit SRP68 n=1 Tax=[Candida] subhashii TaxID=561895 RepID=A0A8J5UL04_9ASCO|nr:SRP68 [[Candida] subhashii]KAG7665703.1 SRP68 [[Candida] subhashii]
MDSPLNITLGARMSAYLVTPDDYRKQRKRINRRLYKLRHELGLITRDTKNYSTKEKTSKITGEDYERDSKYGLVYLLTAERDILYALEIKNLLEISNEKSSSYKTLMISKIKRALSNAVKVLELTQNDNDDLRKVELYVYAALIQGQLSVTKKQWSKALNAFSIAKCSLDYLYSQQSISNEGEDIEQQQFNKTLINELVDTLVDPSLNLAISQADTTFATTDLKSISRKHCHDNEVGVLGNVIKLIESKDPSFVSDISESVELIKEIDWRDHHAQLYNDEIAFKIMELSNNKQEWTSFNDPNQFDSIITSWTEILELHKLDTEKNQDDDDLEQVQHRAIFLTYLNYNLLFTRLKRDLLLIDQLASKKEIENNKDIIRLYNGIIIIVQELKDLPGVYNDDDLYTSLENLEKYYQSQKSIVIAESYQYNGQFGESLKIYNYIEEELLSSIDEEYYKTDFPFDVSTNQEINRFKQDLKTRLLQSHISAQFALSSRGTSQYVIENLTKFPNGDLENIINLSKTPKIEPILPKPVLFDVAFNYISYDLGRTKTTTTTKSPVVTESAEEEQGGKKRGGFFGMFGRS